MADTHAAADAGIDDVRRIVEGRHDDPFAILGPHEVDGVRQVRAFDANAVRMEAIADDGTAATLTALDGAPGFFAGEVPGRGPYRLRGTAGDGTAWEGRDPYAFGPVLTAADERAIAEGTHERLWRVLGAHVREVDGVAGVQFAVWAPNARRVSVVGGFNAWDGRKHAMRRRGQAGAWEIFLPHLGEGTVYKYEIVGAQGEVLPLKADPMGYGSQHPPENASVVRDILGYGWKDAAWLDERAGRHSVHAPISVYEVHLGSWARVAAEDNRMLSYQEAAVQLVEYVADMGFTHIEFMPLSEHPFSGSWGYQPVGLYAPTIRHGTPHELRDLIEAAHARGLGVLMDWVPGHFPTDAHGPGRFDGTALYEYADPREGFHPDWNTYIYDYARPEVQNFLVANAVYWLDEFHVDGLRVDAVASMLYRDYSRLAGEWVPNREGGRENFEAIQMMQRMNRATYDAFPGIATVAEESTSYPGVSRPTDIGGLGFGYKWNMGWMNDTLDYIQRDPIHRKYHHHQMTFGLHYAFSENFILPISHDEVVHGKGSMIGKMPGDDAQKFANLRVYYGFMWGHPGKKLLFMGQEFAQSKEWNAEVSLPWDEAEMAPNAGVRRLVRDLNSLYRAEPSLHVNDCHPAGFEWIEANDSEESVYAWIRRGHGEHPPVAVICNFTPIERPAWQVGLPKAGRWREALNTDADLYGGTNKGNMGAVEATAEAWHGQPASARMMLPGLSAVYLVHEED